MRARAYVSCTHNNSCLECEKLQHKDDDHILRTATQQMEKNKGMDGMCKMIPCTLSILIAINRKTIYNTIHYQVHQHNRMIYQHTTQ